MQLHVGRAAKLAATLAIGVSLAGCSVGHSAAGAKPTPSASQHQSADDPASEISRDAQSWVCCPPAARGPDKAIPQRDPMVELWTAPAPRGSGPQISLRFLRALQRGDELAAASELSAWGRTLLAQAGMSAIHRVMRDVVRHAELDRTGMCSRARSLSANAAVVSCGSRHVVVHLGDWITPGVLISAEHPRHDVYRGPHTHAFTTLDLLTLR